MKKALLFLTLIVMCHVSFSETKTDTLARRTDTLTRKLDTAVTAIKTDVKVLKTSVDTIKSKVSDTSSKKECNCIPVDKRKDNWENIGGFGIFLSLIPFLVFICVGVVLVIKLWKFPLREALSESTVEKVTKLNPEYDADKVAQIIKDAGGNQAVVTSLSTIFPATIDVSDIPDAMSKNSGSNTTSNDSSAQGQGAQQSGTQDAATQNSGNTAANSGTATTTGSTQTGANAPGANTVSAAGKPRLYRPSSSRLIAFISSLFALIIVMSMTCFYIYNYLYTGCAPQLSALTGVLVTLGIGVLPYGANKIASAIKANKDNSDNQ